MVVVVFGLPGSGKSFFAERLAERLHAPCISSDVLRKRILPAPEYSVEEKWKVYDKMLWLMRIYMFTQPYVILDGTFYKAEIRDRFTRVADQVGMTLKFIELRAGDALIRKRLGRKRESSDADYEVHRKIKEQFEPLKAAHLVLDSTDENIEELLTGALDYLNYREA